MSGPTPRVAGQDLDHPRASGESSPMGAERPGATGSSRLLPGHPAAGLVIRQENRLRANRVSVRPPSAYRSRTA